MKNLFLLFFLGLMLSPMVSNAQADCFVDITNGVSGIPIFDAGLACALEEVGVNCPVATGSEEVTIYFSPANGNMENCQLWCNDGGPNWTDAEEQLVIFNNILAFAEEVAPICAENGQPMVLTGVTVDQNGAGQAFIEAWLTFDCCVLPEDCEADFILEWDVDNCEYNAINASTASTFVDCGDCLNPSGITSVSWNATSIFSNGQWVSITQLGSSNDYNFNFNLDNLGKFDEIRVCLTIEDCNGCRSSSCQSFSKLSPCFGFAGDDTESKRLIETIPVTAVVYPNPAGNSLNLQVNQKDFDAANASVEIHDLQGKLVKSINNISTGVNVIDISNLSSNLYILNLIIDGDRVHTEKVVVEK